MCGFDFGWLSVEAYAAWAAAFLLFVNLILFVCDGRRRDRFELARTRAHIRLINNIPSAIRRGGKIHVEAPFILRNIGSSNAMNVMVVAHLSDSKNFRGVLTLRHAVDRVFSAQDESGKVIHTIAPQGESMLARVEAEFYDLPKDKRGIEYAYFYAIIRYSDVLGNTWTREVKRKISIVSLLDGRAFIQPAGEENETRREK